MQVHVQNTRRWQMKANDGWSVDKTMCTIQLAHQIYAEARTIIPSGSPQFPIANTWNDNRLRLSHLQKGTVSRKKMPAKVNERGELQTTRSMHIILQTSSISSCKWHDSKIEHGYERHEPLFLSFLLSCSDCCVIQMWNVLQFNDMFFLKTWVSILMSAVWLWMIK